MDPLVRKGSPTQYLEWPYENTNAGSYSEIELFMNKKKLERLEGWFVSISKRRATQDILVVTGPAGSGKTFTVRSLARKYNIFLQEPNNDKGTAIIKAHIKSKYRPLEFSEQAVDRSIELFDNFSCSEFKPDFIPSIFLADGASIVIVTDPCSFEPPLTSWLRPLLNNPRVCHIEYELKAICVILITLVRSLSFPKTLMQKALASYKKNITCSDIIEFFHGDLRAALIALEMVQISGKPLESHDLFLQDHSLGLFHSLGKFLYPRKRPDPYDPALLWPEDLGMFNLYLHHNMTPCVLKISSLSHVLTLLSQIDLIETASRIPDHWKREYLALPARGLSNLVTNIDRASCGQIKMTRPQYLDLRLHKQAFIQK